MTAAREVSRSRNVTFFEKPFRSTASRCGVSTDPGIAIGLSPTVVGKAVGRAEAQPMLAAIKRRAAHRAVLKAACRVLEIMGSSFCRSQLQSGLRRRETLEGGMTASGGFSEVFPWERTLTYGEGMKLRQSGPVAGGHRIAERTADRLGQPAREEPL